MPISIRCFLALLAGGLLLHQDGRTPLSSVSDFREDPSDRGRTAFIASGPFCGI